MVPQLTRAIMMMQMINCGRCKYFKQNDTEAANFDAKLLGFAKKLSWKWKASSQKRESWKVVTVLSEKKSLWANIFFLCTSFKKKRRDASKAAFLSRRNEVLMKQQCLEIWNWGINLSWLTAFVLTTNLADTEQEDLLQRASSSYFHFSINQLWNI